MASPLAPGDYQISDAGGYLSLLSRYGGMPKDSLDLFSAENRVTLTNVGLVTGNSVDVLTINAEGTRVLDLDWVEFWTAPKSAAVQRYDDYMWSDYISFFIKENTVPVTQARIQGPTFNGVLQGYLKGNTNVLQGDQVQKHVYLSPGNTLTLGYAVNNGGSPLPASGIYVGVLVRGRWMSKNLFDRILNLKKE